MVWRRHRRGVADLNITLTQLRAFCA
ncbi:MAG: hypothetical protein QOG45_1322, partial [Chloroflexota bacterium]|nr:hypothetical protein [Chloroflexota bacterium]